MLSYREKDRKVTKGSDKSCFTQGLSCSVNNPLPTDRTLSSGPIHWSFEPDTSSINQLNLSELVNIYSLVSFNFLVNHGRLEEKTVNPSRGHDNTLQKAQTDGDDLLSILQLERHITSLNNSFETYKQIHEEFLSAHAEEPPSMETS